MSMSLPAMFRRMVTGREFDTPESVFEPAGRGGTHPGDEAMAPRLSVVPEEYLELPGPGLRGDVSGASPELASTSITLGDAPMMSGPLLSPPPLANPPGSSTDRPVAELEPFPFHGDVRASDGRGSETDRPAVFPGPYSGVPDGAEPPTDSETLLQARIAWYMGRNSRLPARASRPTAKARARRPRTRSGPAVGHGSGRAGPRDQCVRVKVGTKIVIVHASVQGGLQAVNDALDDWERDNPIATAKDKTIYLFAHLVLNLKT